MPEVDHVRRTYVVRVVQPDGKMVSKAVVRLSWKLVGTDAVTRDGNTVDRLSLAAVAEITSRLRRLARKPTFPINAAQLDDEGLDLDVDWVREELVQQ